MNPRLRVWLPLITVVALLALVAASVVDRWDVLTESPFPLGVDGYYYPIQLRALLETGSLHYPTAPVALWLMAPFAAVTDPIVGAKLAAAIGGALIALPAYAVGCRLGRSRVAGLVAAALATPSAGSAFLTIEFVKQSIGMTLAVTAIALGLRALDRRTRVSIGLAIAAYAATLGAHKLAAAFATIILAPAVIAELAPRLRATRVVAMVVGLVGLAIVAIIVAPRGFIGVSDLRLASHLFTATPLIEAPALAGGTFDIRFGDEALVGALVGILAIVILVATRRRASPANVRAASWATCSLAVFIGFPWLAYSDPQGLTFRLRASAFVPLALAGAVVIGAMVPWLAVALRGSIARLVASRARARRDDHPMSAVVRRVSSVVLVPLAWCAGEPDASDASDPGIDRSARLAANGILVAVAIALALRVPGDRHEAEVVAHPMLVAATLAVADHVPQGEAVIIPERHIAYMVAWYTRREVSIQPEPISPERRWRLIPRRFFDASPDADQLDLPLDQAFDAARRQPGVIGPIDVHARLHDGIVVMPEATWAWVVAHLPSAEQARVQGWPTR